MTHEHSAPEWQTLTQRLSTIVYNREHPVGIAFNNFCVNLQTSYREIIHSLESIDKNNDHHGPTYEDFYVVSEKDYGLNQNFLENQRNLICSHVYQITELLAEVFGNYWDMFVRKIRLCYEKCLYNRVGRDLISMYRLVHTKPMHDLQRNIIKLKTLQISQLQLQMKWEWWLQLFAPQNEADESDGVSYTDDVDGSPCDDDAMHWDGGYLSEMEPDSSDPVAFLTDIGEDEIGDTCSGCCESGSGHVGCFGRSLSADTTVMNPDRGAGPFRSYSVSSVGYNGSCGKAATGTTVPDDAISSSPLPERCKKVNGVIITQNSVDIVNIGSNTSIADEQNNCPPLQPGDTLVAHFGPALQSIRNVFSNPSPLKKMQCLTAALRLISKKVEDLRLREHSDVTKVNREKVMVTAEDLLPLVVLVLLQLLPEEVAKLYVELLFVSDMMAEFLSSGCHSFALCEFQIAFRVIEQTCDELSIW